MLVALSFGALTAVAAETTPGKSFGTVFHLRGEVLAKSKSGVTRTLKKGDLVYAGEQLRSGAASEAVIKTKDAGIVAIRPNTEWVMERYAANGKATDHQFLKLMTGSLRIISGWIGQINRDQHRVITPGATIGIRGTDHEPYVLKAELGNGKFSPGTYDKVNRGQTVLDANGAGINIDKGRVGYVRDKAATAKRQRAMLTLLMPVLLDEEPDFYTGGSFDLELDEYSAQAEDAAQQALSALQITGDDMPLEPDSLDAGVPVPGMGTAVAQVAAPVLDAELQTPGCAVHALGLAWLASLDSAIEQRDAAAILGLFASDVAVKATVFSGGSPTTITFSREEMVQSTLKSVASLKAYQQRRESSMVTLAQGTSSADCHKLRVRSVSIEQGQMSGRSFRFEALEEYDLEKRNGAWQAVAVHTKQQ